MNHSKRYYIIFFLFFTLTYCFAQNQRYMDSLRTLISKQQDKDTMKTIHMNLLAFEYSYVDLDSGMRLAMQGLKLAEEMGHESVKANFYNTIATIYHDQGNFHKAVEYFHKARTNAEKRKDKQMMAVVYANMGNTYEMIGDYANARHYLFESLRLFRELGHTRRFAGAYLNIGILYNSNKQFDSAMYFFNEALKHPIKNEAVRASIHSSMATCYRDMGKLKEAEQEWLLGLKIIEDLHSEYYESNYNSELASIYILQGRYDEAEKLVQKSLAYAKKDRLMAVEVESNQYLYQIYAARKNYQKALEYHLEYSRLSDSLNNKERNNAARELEKKYQTEKKELEIGRLNEEKKASEMESKRKGQLLTVTLLGGLLVLCALGFAIFSFVKMRKAHGQLQVLNREVLLQKDELQDKNKSITDSIHYAQRIQKVLLTSQAYISESLPEFFILNKPKDIVSGDFYWAIRQDSQFYFQVADCTGHGVPGAFMSLLGISFLNEIVLERNITRPDQVLDRLRAEIMKVFTDKDNLNNQMNDGMDCVLCKFDLRTNTLQYAAANNSIILIRRGDILQLSGDKMPVGKSPRDQEPFGLNTFQLEKGDLLYMFTDGYPDQFGGEKGKKFKVKNVKQLLHSLSAHSMEEQRSILHDYFEKWRGNLEQVDDVLMVGIRIQ